MPEPDETPEAPAPDSATSAADAPGRPTLMDSITDFVRLFVDYVRQETGDLVHDKIVLPTQKAGAVVAFALAAAGVLVLGIAFIAVALVMLLAQAVTWPGALLIIGGVLVLGAGGLTAAKMRSMQK